MEAENKRREDKRNGREEDRINERVEDRGNEEEQETTFRFPILDTSSILGEEVKMKNIPPSILPNFYGITSEYPHSFLFEFDILCRTYGYTDDTHKLRLFPATLKTPALKWFMGLGEHTITSWHDMINIFPKNIKHIVDLKIRRMIFLRCLSRKMKVWKNILRDFCII